jgi:hypothetical protein
MSENPPRLILTHVSDRALVGIKQCYGPRVLYVEPMPDDPREWRVLVSKASAIEARRAAAGNTDAVADESAVAKPDAQP